MISFEEYNILKTNLVTCCICGSEIYYVDQPNSIEIFSCEKDGCLFYFQVYLLHKNIIEIVLSLDFHNRYLFDVSVNTDPQDIRVIDIFIKNYLDYKYPSDKLKSILLLL